MEITPTLNPNDYEDLTGSDVISPDREFDSGDYGTITGTLEPHPLAPIRKEPSSTRSGNVTGYGIEIYDDSADEDETPWDLVGSVSKEYLLVPNGKVVESAQRIAKNSPFDFVPRKLFWDGKRMVLSIVTEDEAATKDVADVGDTIALGMMFENSYNGSTSYRASIFAERLICGNGMVSTKRFATYKFRHTISDGEDWEKEQERVLSVLQGGAASLKNVVRGLSLLQGTGDLGMTDLQRIRQEAIPNLAVTRWGQILDEFLGGEESSEEGGTNLTGYGLMNAATRKLWHRDRSISDYNNNQYVVDGLLDYAFNNLN